MSGQALYLKYRPRVFDDMIGQQHITQTIRASLAQDRLRHAYLFSGPRGTGKTTLARILAKAVNCTYPDVSVRPCDLCDACKAVNEGHYLDLIEIDAASNNGVDDVRELRDKIGYAPNEGRHKVYVIDEVHRFSAGAFDALLKTLEEPPDHAIFILATTEIEKVPATIKSRCLKFEFRRVSTAEVADRLGAIAEYEGLTVDRDALELIARQGGGSVRDSISLLDQVVADPTQHITLAVAEAVLGTANYRAVGALVGALIEANAARGLEILNAAIDEGVDPRQLAGQMVEHLRNVMLVQVSGPGLVEGSDEQRALYVAQVAGINRAALVRAVRLFNTAVTEMRSSWQPQLPLELAIVEATRPLVEEAAPRPVAHNKGSKAKAVPETPTEVVSEPEEPVPVGEFAKGASLADVRRVWPEMLARFKGEPKFVPLEAKLRHAEPRSLEGSLLTLAVNNVGIIKSLDDAENRAIVGRAVAKLLNLPALAVKIVSGSAAAQANTVLPDDLDAFKRETGAVVRTEP